MGLFSFIGSALGVVGKVFGAKKKTSTGTQTINFQNQLEAQRRNLEEKFERQISLQAQKSKQTMMFLGIGAGAIVLIIFVMMMMKK